MLKYTGHPFLDVGLAVITVFNEKEKPEDLTQDDLVKMANFIKDHYNKNPIKGYLSTILLNSAYVNPTMGEDKKEIYYQTYLYGFLQSSNELNTRCVFYEKPAVALADRSHIPLLSAKTDFNFVPNCQIGLPISGEASLAMQTMPLGTMKCQGKVLLIHSNNEQITQIFAQKHLKQHWQYLSLSSEKYDEVKYPKTIVLDYLREIISKIQDTTYVDVYYFTNYGTNPDIDIFHLPMYAVKFLQKANTAKYSDIWDKIVYRAWEYKIIEDGKGQTKKRSIAGVRDKAGEARNYLYEDFFALPDNAYQFVRTYFLRNKTIRKWMEDQRADYALSTDIKLISWNITALFLREIINMELERIEKIKRFGDKLAEYISSTNDKKLFNRFYRNTKQYRDLTNLLIQANHNRVKEQKSPLIDFEEYIDIFESGDNLPYKDWRLVRDLITIRLIEQLYTKDWFNKNQDLLEESLEENSEEQTKELVGANL